MVVKDKTVGSATKWLRWIARIWSLPIILYALLMLTGYAWNLVTIGTADPYAVEDCPLIESLPPIFMFISIFGLGIAWRWEGVGAAITLVFECAVLVLLLIDRPLTQITQDFSRIATPYIISLVVTIPGILFLLCWWRSRELPASQNNT